MKKVDKLRDSYEGIIKAFESPGKGFDEFGDDDKADLDKAFEPIKNPATDSEPEAKPDRDGVQLLDEAWDDNELSDRDIMKKIEEEIDGIKAAKFQEQENLIRESFKQEDLEDINNAFADKDSDYKAVLDINANRDGVNDDNLAGQFPTPEDSEDKRVGYIAEPNHELESHSVMTEAQFRSTEEDIQAEIPDSSPDSTPTPSNMQNDIGITNEDFDEDPENDDDVDEYGLYKVGDTGDVISPDDIRGDTLTEGKKKALEELRHNDLEELNTEGLGDIECPRCGQKLQDNATGVSAHMLSKHGVDEAISSEIDSLDSIARAEYDKSYDELDLDEKQEVNDIMDQPNLQGESKATEIREDNIEEWWNNASGKERLDVLAMAGQPYGDAGTTWDQVDSKDAIVSLLADNYNMGSYPKPETRAIQNVGDFDPTGDDYDFKFSESKTKEAWTYEPDDGFCPYCDEPVNWQDFTKHVNDHRVNGDDRLESLNGDFQTPKDVVDGEIE